jgi:cytochrome c-type biogenesis protein CcmE
MRAIKIVVVVALFAVVAIAFLLGLMGLDHNRETTLPTPTGPFAVGRTT